MVVDWKTQCSKDLNPPQIDLQSESKSDQMRWLFLLCFVLMLFGNTWYARVQKSRGKFQNAYIDLQGVKNGQDNLEDEELK